jgi:hypothetical protein
MNTDFTAGNRGRAGLLPLPGRDEVAGGYATRVAVVVTWLVTVTSAPAAVNKEASG